MGMCVCTLVLLAALAVAQTPKSEIPMSDAARGVIPNRFPPTTADQIRAILPIQRPEEVGSDPQAPSQLLEDILSEMPSRRDAQSLQLIGRPSTTPFELWTARQAQSPAGDFLVSAAALRHKVPKDAQKAYERGIKALQRGEFSQALEELGKAVALDGEYAAAHANLGVAMVRQERFADAEVEIRRAIALNPSLPMVHSNLAWVLARLGRLQEAAEVAKRALEAEPENKPARTLLEALDAR